MKQEENEGLWNQFSFTVPSVLQTLRAVTVSLCIKTPRTWELHAASLQSRGFAQIGLSMLNYIHCCTWTRPHVLLATLLSVPGGTYDLFFVLAHLDTFFLSFCCYLALLPGVSWHPQFGWGFDQRTVIFPYVLSRHLTCVSACSGVSGEAKGTGSPLECSPVAQPRKKHRGKALQRAAVSALKHRLPTQARLRTPVTCWRIQAYANLYVFEEYRHLNLNSASTEVGFSRWGQTAPCFRRVAVCA